MLYNILYKTMKTYCVSCQKNTAKKTSSVRKAKPNRLMLLSNYAVCGKKINQGSLIINNSITYYLKIVLFY